MRERTVGGIDGAAEIAVVGSLNLDLVVGVPRLPSPGETVVGDDLFRNPGGKGANQAVAASRLGRRVGMVGCVGDDEAGTILLDALRADGVDPSHVRVVPGVPSGTALIAVGPDGENQIVVSPGANAVVGRPDVEGAESLLRSSRVTLLQLEIPLDAVHAAAAVAGGMVVLNPAPARDLPPEIVSLVDLLVPNRLELAHLSGERVPDTAEQAARLAGELVPSAVVTLGAEGAVVVREGRWEAIPPVPIRPVDTTAAGDAFCAALADGLARDMSVADAAGWAVRVAAAACMRRGAQDSLPTREEALAIS